MYSDENYRLNLLKKESTYFVLHFDGVQKTRESAEKVEDSSNSILRWV